MAMSGPGTLAPTDRTTRMSTASDDDTGDLDPGESNGIPIAADVDDVTLTPRPQAVVPIDGPEPTRRLATLTLGEIFAVLWALQGPAKAAGIDLDIQPFPALEPTGIHLWSTTWLALCRWLKREKERHFCTVPVERILDGDDKIDAGRFLLVSLAETLPLARVIEVGPRKFAHWVWRVG